MDSILNWYVEEGTIFKGGSGSGINLSNIRSSQEPLNGGGTASGPVSFMRGADASAGTIKSGGKTRRAAKMVILDADHPDIEDFVWCKAIEERKARALARAGFDMDLDGKDSHSTQYQNANNSVRVTDEFMQAVLDDADWELKAVTTGEVVQSMKARDLYRQMAQAAWECADPGMQFDTTINRWHTSSNTGRINASNPCFPGDQRVHTDKGLIRFDELFDRARQGEAFGVYTHDATSPEAPAERVEVTRPEAFMITGVNEIVRLRFSNGMELRCTPNHRLFTTNRGYVPASELTPQDHVKTLDLPAVAVSADLRLPVSTDVAAYAAKGDWSRSLRLPEKWTPEFAHYLGWLVGDGCIAGDVVTTVYGGGDDQNEILPRHLELLSWMNGDRTPFPSTQANATVQLRQSRRVIARFLEALGVSHAKAADKVVPWAVEQAPPEALAAFLRGLFDADGCVYDGHKSRYVGLGSASAELLRGVQRLLSTLGISSRVYPTRQAADGAFSYVRKDGGTATYGSQPQFDLRISSRSIAAFAEHINFSVPAKREKLASLIANHRFYDKATAVQLVERTDDGVELTYNLTESRNHSYVVQGLPVSNCSEYMHLDNSACNLASLNLLRFLNDDGSFDVEGFRAAVSVMFTAQEILVGNADYPTESVAETSRRFRQLGLGYANLGAMLMALGLPYDSDGGRAWAGAITALMTGQAYATSARTAARMGPFAGYTENREPMTRVLGMHRDEVAKVDAALVPDDLLSAAAESWDTAIEWSDRYGVRNSQATVLAPTGCLVGGSLVATDRGLVRLGSLGDPDGPQWQDLGATVATDEGPRAASRFYVNGLEPVVTVDTARGHRIQGTPQHRVKVVDPATGEWQWRRFADVTPGDLVPLALDQMVGDPRSVPLPSLGAPAAGDGVAVSAPEEMTVELAELAGYAVGAGSVDDAGLHFTAARSDFEVVERLERLGKAAFGLPAAVALRPGATVEVDFASPRLAAWWAAVGLGGPRLPDAVLATNDRWVYAAYLRGLFEGSGGVVDGCPHLSTSSTDLALDVQALLLALGYPATRSASARPDAPAGATTATISLVDAFSTGRWLEEIGFVSGRKHAAVVAGHDRRTGSDDLVPVPAGLVERLLPARGRLRQAVLAQSRTGGLSRSVAARLWARTGDAELERLLSFSYDAVDSATLGAEELTFDLSVPDNVTYVANGFVSHNTIGLMMDCDTTGIEPDLGLCKTKKLVGGGTMSIVNQTVPRALGRLGYTPTQVAEIIAYIDEHKSIVGAPHLSPDHLPVFACSMGDNVIHYSGHVRMMGAAQPWISGAISKTVNVPEDATVEDVEQLHIDAWRLGLKAIAIYRDNCKVAQPLSTTKKTTPATAAVAVASALAAPVERLVDTVVVREPVRAKLPRRRNSKTMSFRVADCHGYVIVGEYDDGRPGEIFLKVAKQGSTLAGIMDAFAISVSHGLQYGVPLRAFVDMYTNMRFEPAGMTDDPDIRFASSLVDYIFRRMAVEYLPFEDRAELGILTVGERTQPTLPGVEETTTLTSTGSDVVPDPAPMAAPEPVPAAVAPVSVSDPVVQVTASDAPYCYQCGMVMQRAGACFVCSSCGTTSGCS
jgi:ribonucleoside-diphosphate reductase alpha chain